MALVEASTFLMFSPRIGSSLILLSLISKTSKVFMLNSSGMIVRQFSDKFSSTKAGNEAYSLGRDVILLRETSRSLNVCNDARHTGKDRS